jgi:phage RecT family recombinase
VTGPVKTTALAPMHGGEPYSSEGQRLAPHPSKVDEHALALRSKLGKILLTGQSEFKVIATAAGIPAERLVLELISVARKKPEILACTEDSIMTFMFDAAKLGLMIGRGVFPVPVKNRKRGTVSLEAWVGYKGGKELAMTSGAIRDCWAFVVFEGDLYEKELAPVPRVVNHVPGPNAGNMAKAIEVYGTALLPGAGNQTRSVFLSREAVEKLRKKNRGDTTAPDSPWVTSTEDMWKAKAILQLTKDMPQNPRLAHLQALTARFELDPAREVQPAPDAAALPAGSPVEEEELPAEPVEETMSLGKAGAITVTLQGGETRMLSELRNSGLESVRSWARKKLEADEENPSLLRIAEGCTVLLDARAAGTLREPPKKAAA